MHRGKMFGQFIMGPEISRFLGQNWKPLSIPSVHCPQSSACSSGTKVNASTLPCLHKELMPELHHWRHTSFALSTCLLSVVSTCSNLQKTCSQPIKVEKQSHLPLSCGDRHSSQDKLVWDSLLQGMEKIIIFLYSRHCWVSGSTGENFHVSHQLCLLLSQQHSPPAPR